MSLFFLLRPSKGSGGSVTPPPVIPDDGLDPNRFFVGGSITGRTVRDPRVPYVSALKGYFSAVQEWPQYQRKYARELEKKVQEIDSNDSPEDIQQLSESIQSLVRLLTKPKAVEPVIIEAAPLEIVVAPIPVPVVMAAPEPPPIPAILIQKLVDLIAKEKSDHEDDEFIISLLLQ